MWEVAQILGLCAVAACLVLCMLAVRPRAKATGAFPLRAHELLGWTALAAALLHVALLLVADHEVVDHLRPSTPRYELAGILALLMLVFLTAPAGTDIRGRLWSQHRNFQAVHVGAACLLVVAVAIHVVTTDRYIHGRSQWIVYGLLSGIVVAGLLRPRARTQRTQQLPGFIGGLVFGRHSRLMLAIIAAALVALLALMRADSTRGMREPLLLRDARLFLNFPHDRHRTVNCVLCHHNFADQTGGDSCVSCHRSGRADLLAGVEARFHDFCLDCHRDPPAYLSGHGPVTGCGACHAPP